MSNEIVKVFESNEFGKIRTVVVDNEPWFVGRDICNAFDDKNSSRSLGRVDEDDKRIIDILDSKNRTQSVIFVNESGLYSLLFAMQPQKANHGGVSDAYPIEVQERIVKLHKFKRWVTSDILPSIRKTGSYSINQSNNKPDSYMIEDPIARAKRWIEEQEEKLALEEKIKQDAPLVEFANHVSDTSDLIDISTLAKIAEKDNISLGRNDMFKWLRNNGYLIPDGVHKNEPYQKFIDQGYFVVKEIKYYKGDNKCLGTKTYITGKGQIYLIKKLNKYFNY